MTITDATPMRSIGDLPRSVWAAKLAGSPMESELDAIITAASPYGALCLCQAIRESSLGRDQSAQANHNAWGLMKQYPILYSFPSWAAGAAFFKKTLANETIYPPHDITMLDFVRTYVGGPLCRQTEGRVCNDVNASGTNPKYLVSLLADLNKLTTITPAPTPTPDPPPVPVNVDPISVIVGNKPYTIIAGFKDFTNLPYYSYFEGHGGHANEHTGLDVSGTLGQTLFTPLAGVVTCAGTGNGGGSWSTGCAAFPDYFGHGAGRVEILLDGGLSMILGHCSEALVKPGQKVQAGQAVARMGGMNSYHTHLECRIWKNGDYLIIDPVPALKQAMGGVAPVVYADRLPISQPDDTPPYWVVRVTKDQLPVLQYGDAGAPPVAPPLAKGEEFQAQFKLPGTDGAGYWVSTQRGRVPIDGTELVKVVTG